MCLVKSAYSHNGETWDRMNVGESKKKCALKKFFSGNFYILKIAITWPKIIQTSQVGDVLETSGPPFDDGHRDFED